MLKIKFHSFNKVSIVDNDRLCQHYVVNIHNTVAKQNKHKLCKDVFSPTIKIVSICLIDNGSITIS